jgi:hypothetical protein
MTFPPEFVVLLDSLGIDPRKPAELCHWCREEAGRHLTGGFFHLVGTITNGEDVIRQVGESHGVYKFEDWVLGCQFGFTSQIVLLPEVFAGLSVTQLEFQTRVPWVLGEPEPD